MKQERLHKIIASTQLMSRRKAEEAITAGRVTLNGVVVMTLGTLADSSVDEIKVDGIKLKFVKKKTIIAFHKPPQVIVSKGDPQGRKTVYEFLPQDLKVNPVGRLDYDSEGLLLLTDDGELANRLMHPSFGVKKIYEVEVKGVPTEGTLNRLLNGVPLEDGRGKFLGVRIMKKKRDSNSVLKITVDEGRNRFIRRMLKAVDHRVIRLKRVAIGSIQLGDLEVGCHRELSTEEKKYLSK